MPKDAGIERTIPLIRSPLSVAGMVVTTISAVVFLVVFLADLFGFHSNPYIGILFFLILPGIFMFGLFLIPLGAWIERRRRAAGKRASDFQWPRIDLNNPHHRRVAVAVFTLTMANVVIVSLAAYRGVEYMDSVQFCGQVCHSVMKPEATAHQDGPHARVTCVECHIGSGATWFAKSKISGTRQLVAVSLHTYSRPIPSPVQNLRPARDTCEQCHWPAKFHGDKVQRIVEYSNNEKNTESVTTLQMHVGGASGRAGAASEIHWHADVANEIDYIATDDKRQVIPYVRVKDRTGAVREYVVDGVTPDQLAKGERRRMDCMDCHNRPSHQMASTAERAIDSALARADIPSSLPFVRREAVKVLKVSYPTEDAAMQAIAKGLRDFYGNSYQAVYTTRRPDVEKAVLGAQQVYRRNVFPEMNVQFGTYPNNAGHVDFPGCFRCHDDNHKASDGRKINQDCETCHKIE
ncbi:MAG: NapC/NirT family cytochrome c [Acidobacteriota bacterium]